MNFEDLIAAKVKYAQADAVVGMWVCGILTLLGIVLVVGGWLKAKDSYSELPWIGIVCGAGLIFIFGLALGSAVIQYSMADVKARAELSNYNLIELKK